MHQVTAEAPARFASELGNGAGGREYFLRWSAVHRSKGIEGSTAVSDSKMIGSQSATGPSPAQILCLARGFWGRGEALVSWPLSAAILLTILLALAASYGMNVWYRVIFDAMQSREARTVLSLSLLYLPLLAGSVLVSVMQLRLRMSIQRRWRAWLNNRLLVNGFARDAAISLISSAARA